MSDQKEKIQIFPTPMAKQQMKAKLKIAEKGHNMLKKKVEVLDMRFRKVGKEIIQVKRIIGDILSEASFLLAEARFVTGDFTQTVLNKTTDARIRVKHRTENVAGVKLDIFESIIEGPDYYGLTGLAKGGEKLNSLKTAFVNATDILIELATLQTTFVNLDEVIKSTNRRVNALEQVYIPKIKKTIEYIDSEMDENARQDFYRMKQIKRQKIEIINKSASDNDKTENDSPKETESDSPQETDSDSPQETDSDSPQETESDSPQETKSDSPKLPKNDSLEEILRKLNNSTI